VRAVLALLLVTTSSAAADPLFELGLGTGAFWGHDDVDITRTTSLFFQLGFHLSDKLDVLGGVEGFSGNYSPEPTNEQRVAGLVGGVRWFPYGRARRNHVKVEAIYLQAVAGVSLLTLVPYDSFLESNDPDAAGVLGGASFGWMPGRLDEVSLGFEARGDVILYNADAGFRQALSFNLLLQLDLD
jgi:hypothetical protein